MVYSPGGAHFSLLTVGEVKTISLDLDTSIWTDESQASRSSQIQSLIHMPKRLFFFLGSV